MRKLHTLGEKKGLEYKGVRGLGIPLGGGVANRLELLSGVAAQVQRGDVEDRWGGGGVGGEVERR